MTDNAFEYVKSTDFAKALTETKVRRHVRIRPYHPWTNGKVERFKLALKREWAYARIYTSNDKGLATRSTWNRFRRHSPRVGTTLRAPC